MLHRRLVAADDAPQVRARSPPSPWLDSVATVAEAAKEVRPFSTSAVANFIEIGAGVGKTTPCDMR